MRVLVGCLLALLAAACVSELAGTVERRCPESAVKVHAEQTGLDYASCGSLSADRCTAAGPTTEESAALECFAAALADCTPARLDVRSLASEGSFLKIHLVEPGDSCRVSVLLDDRDEAAAARPGVARVLCEKPEVSDACPDVITGECSAPVTLCLR